jgi:hypothetical protein
MDELIGSDSIVESDGEAKPIPSSDTKLSVDADGNIGFFNARDPQYELQSERPIHREMCHMAMRGYTNTEIAREYGVSAPMVGYVLLQPWAKKYMSENMHRHGMEKVETLLKGAVADAVERLITEMDNDKARPAERISAAEKIIERVYGRAAQPLIHVSSAPAKEMSDAELDQEIERLQRQRNGHS